MHWRPLGFDGRRMMQIERPEWQVHEVTPEVRERTAAKMPPVPPVEVRPFGMIRLLFDGAEPQVPIEVFGHGREFLVALLATVVGTDPHMHFAHLADGAASDKFHDA